MNTCSTCKNNISTYSDIYRCFDLDFCSIDCRDKTLKLVLKKDPNLNNPYYWSDYLNIKKENNVNNFNLYNTRNTFNKKNNVGHFNENEFTISCDTSILKKVYINIRNFLYKIFNECAKTVDYIAFNIDSIYIDQKNLKEAKNFFKLHNLDFKLVLCQKISSLDYTFGKEKRKF